MFRGKVDYPPISHVFSRKINDLHGIQLLKKLYYIIKVPLPFIGTFGIFSVQKCCQNLIFLFRGKVGYSTFCGILTIFSTILN